MQTIQQIRDAYDSSKGAEFQASGRFAIVNCSTREGRSGTFATVELRDPSGSLVARCFDTDSITSLAAAGTIDCRLRISTFNNAISAVVQSFEQVTLDVDEVLRFAGLDAAAHAERVVQIEQWLDECDGTIYGDVLREIFAEPGVWERFTLAPAAVRMHHAEPGGLVRHLCEVGRAGLALLESTQAPFDRAYFLAGVLLHDIGKLDTYTTPPTIAYTAQGQLAEHQIYSTFRLAKACAATGAERSTEARLIHIIEQAHGAYRHAEWQDPLGVEAKALAAADFFSSRLGITEKERKAQAALDDLIAEDSQSRAEAGLAMMPSTSREASSAQPPSGLF